MAGTGINGPFNFTTREYFDNAGNPNAAKGSTLSFEELDETLLFLSASAASASGAVLTSAVTSNVIAGAIGSGTTIQAGTTFQQFVQQLLVTYIEPTITGVQAWYNGSQLSTYTYDVGVSINVDEVKWSTTNDSPNGNPPQYYGDITVTVDGIPYNAGMNASPYALLSPQLITRNAVATTNVVVEGYDENLGVVSGTKTISFALRNQFGGYGGPYPTNDSTAQDLFNYLTGSSQTNVFDSDKAFNVTCAAPTQNPSNRTYIMYPTTYGNLSAIVYNNATSILGAFTKLTGPFTINNGYGHSYSVNIYQSNADGAFVVGDDLTIT